MKKKPLEKVMHFRITEDEHREIHQLSQRAGFTKVSQYSRVVLLAKPQRVVHHDASKADLLTMSLELQQDLQKIANCFQQTTGFLSLHPELATWAQINKEDEARFTSMAENISNKLIELNQLWSRD